MPALVIAIGNPLRRDDGVAHYVQVPRGVFRHATTQLTPEVAEEVARYDTVIFVDADARAKEPRMEAIAAAPAGSGRPASPLTHALGPPEVVALARKLYGFSGEAYVCRIPVRDLAEGEGLSPAAKRFVERAEREIDQLLATVSSAGTIK